MNSLSPIDILEEQGKKSPPRFFQPKSLCKLDHSAWFDCLFFDELAEPGFVFGASRFEHDEGKMFGLKDARDRETERL